ncbi:MAG: hypothetical protein ACYCDI_11635 [Corynebacterium aurimucosum]
MKRINRTLTAAVLAGSLALGGTAVASAQIPAPAEFELDGVTYRQQSDGSYLSVNELGQTPLSKDQAQAAWENSPEYQELLKETSNQGEDPAEGEEPSNNEEGSTDGDNSSNNNSSEGESDFDKKQLAWLALPAALVIGGVTWYLAKDGKTYVKSQEAAQKDAPTAEEKAASEQMLQENKDEVIAQGGQIADSTAAQAPAQTRGISAETGSNTVARGLAALAFAAMIAAGAFAARRKFFA